MFKHLIKKAKETTKEEVVQGIKDHKLEIFCGFVAVVAATALGVALKGPRPNVTYVTVNLRGMIGGDI